ncbi:FAD-binding oxidoreductase [Brenneria goodwinii]|uniref:NAD(P)/FAD-dependent oxidoreductase n=1 Tax=Brenneria goodwinii TaxID=1109412 RepID=UPI0036EDA49B
MLADYYDFVVIGGGIAGVSVASELAKKNKVILVEQERQMGYHTTGRSAAISMETYGSEQIRALTKASGDYFRNTLPGGQSLTHKRGALFVCDTEHRNKLERHYQTVSKLTENIYWLESDELQEQYPMLSEQWVAGVYEPDAIDIDVNAYHQYCLKQIIELGSVTKTNAEVTALTRERDHWQVKCNNFSFSAKVIVNTAGAWADNIAVLAGISPLGLEPLKRSALLIECADAVDDLPYVADINESFYFKPDAGLIMISPCDETLELPCDVRPDEIDIAMGMERFENATSLIVNKLKSKWAGLRTFAKDRNPIIGFDCRIDGFFWLAGQGGYGIQTAPAIASLSHSLLCSEPLSHHLTAVGINPLDYSPERFINHKNEVIICQKK